VTRCQRRNHHDAVRGLLVYGNTLAQLFEHGVVIVWVGLMMMIMVVIMMMMERLFGCGWTR
jgi:hypothetical protein